MKIKIKIISLIVLTLCMGLGALASTNIIERIAQACMTVVVTEEDIARQVENTPPTRNWVLYTRLAGNGAFRTGPATPPLPIGSFETVTPTGADKVTLFNFDHVGVPLADINRLGYATIRAAGMENQLPALNLQVDVNGAAAGGFTTLVYEPVYNGGTNIVNGQWQTWDAYNGGQAIWWSSNPIPGAPNRDTFVTWNTILANNPNAVIVGGYGINQGSGNPALTASTDALAIGYSNNSGGRCFIYNFEPYRVATSPEACKNGNWQRTKRANGTGFKNQGDCMQYVNTGK